MTIDLRCDRVSKRYRVPSVKRPREAGSALSRLRARYWTPYEDFWAVRDVDFTVARGEAFGIIGRNGAGKSTMLKLLTGITAPTEGEITIRGRLAALIEVGSGFHPELTGRENAYLSGSILGLRTKDITARLSDIVDFAGIGPFVDVPVKFYSSGMYVRLGFAIAVHLEPDVLLVDEVLAVGDAEFQARCLGRIEALKRRGVTMILVSHDLGAVEQLCDRAVLLDRGRVVAEGAASDVVSAYQRMTSGPDPLCAPTSADVATSPLTVRSLTLLNGDGRSILAAASGKPLTARVVLASQREADVEVLLSFYDFDRGILLAECSSRAFLDPLIAHAGDTTVDFVVPELLLGPGAYTLGVTVKQASASRPVAWHFGRTTLYVEGPPARQGHLLLPYVCRTPGPEAAAAYAGSRTITRTAGR